MMRRVSTIVSGNPRRMHHSRPGDTRSFTRSTFSAVIRSPGATSACAARARIATSALTLQAIRMCPPRRRGPQLDGERNRGSHRTGPRGQLNATGLLVGAAVMPADPGSLALLAGLVLAAAI